MKVKELLSDKSKWTKGAYALTVENKICSTFDKNAVKWCLTSAICKCYSDIAVIADIRVRIKVLIGKSIVGFNDSPSTTFEDIKNLIERLDI